MSSQYPYGGSSGNYPYPYAPPPRPNSSRIIAVVIALIVVGGSGAAVWYGLQIAIKNQQIQSQANRIQGLYGKGAALYEQGRFLDAIPIFQKVRQDPAASGEMLTKAVESEAFCYRMLGQRAQEAKDYRTAEQWFQKAVAAVPGDRSALEELLAVQRAIAILSGKEPSPGAAPAPRHPEGAPPAAPLTPNPEGEAVRNRAGDAMEILQRGNHLMREGNRAGACREWHEAMLLAPGSPAAVQATQLRRDHCNEFSGFGG